MNIPTATYRLQFNPEFGFQQAGGMVSYLADLGISHIPLAATGSFKAHVIAFARTYHELCSITMAPRFLTGLVDEHQYPLGRRVWQDTEIVFNVTNPWRIGNGGPA